MLTVTGAFLGLTFVLLLAVEIGYRFGTRSRTEGISIAEPEKIAETFVLTLLSLILAFTLSAARAHYADRAEMILKEAQSIRSARVALDDLDGEMRTQAMLLLTDYVESKMAYNAALNQAADPADSYEKGRRVLHEIRKICRSESEGRADQKQRTALEKVEHMAEVGLERHVLIRAPHSDVVIRFLFVISVIACFLLGHAHRSVNRRMWWAGLLFAGVIAATLVLIFDYDSPRLGLIRVDSTDVLYDDLSKS